MTQQEIEDFLESFAVMNSLDKFCRFGFHRKIGLFQIRLPKNLNIEVHIHDDELADIKFCFLDGLGSYGKFDLFKQKLLEQNYPFSLRSYHYVYGINNVNLNEVVDIFSNYVNWLVE